MNPIPVNLAIEDLLSEAVLRKMLASSGREFAVGTVYGYSGNGYLRKKVLGFNNAAKGTPFALLTDLDTLECPPMLRKEWVGDTPLHPNLIFRVAVREVESWLLADARAFARFARVPTNSIPSPVEKLNDPKRALIDVIRRSPTRTLREDIVPPPTSSRIQGPDYNGRLIAFVNERWDPRVAESNSDSLKRTMEVFRAFEPTWAAPT